jgi:hypothetical protein
MVGVAGATLFAVQMASSLVDERLAGIGRPVWSLI